MPTLTIPARFNGPPSSGNGGWSAGAFAYALAPGSPAVTVQLRMPPPLDTPLDLAPAMQPTQADDWSTATRDGEVVMRARTHDEPLVPVPPVPLETARAATAAYAGLTSHPFPTCFACGTDREPGDGLRIWPGRVDDDTTGDQPRARVAATWTPTADDGVPDVWAALDCIGAWAGDLTERHLVLGQITLATFLTPAPGEPLVVVGGDRGSDGRRTRSASTLYDADDRVVATAEHVWFAVDPKDFA